jgi:7-cyano-7-deazaguanine reductase
MKDKIQIQTVKNEARCMWTRENHILELPACCPISKNPQPGSTISIVYEPRDLILEVASLRKYIDAYVGGYDGIRSMEGMVQQITADVAEVLGVMVRVEADLILEPKQRMKLVCCA